MLTKIELHGELGKKFGREWNLDISTPVEAFRAIEANSRGIIQHIQESARDGVGYRIIVGEHDITEPELHALVGRNSLKIVPVVSGQKGGLFGVVLGATLIAASLFAGPEIIGLALAAGTSVGTGIAITSGIGFIGASMALNGVTSLLAPNPKTPTQSSGKTLGSYDIGGEVTAAQQGYPVPVLYGRFLITGAYPITTGIKSVQLA